MIDERVFGMPHLARGYVEYLVSHETCHQWWYNLVGTNGYAETFMDEGAATYFTHRLLDQQARQEQRRCWSGRDGLGWLPNIRRENYRYGGMYGAIRNGDDARPRRRSCRSSATSSACSPGPTTAGRRSFGMIEERLGEAAFLDFIRGARRRSTRWRVLQAADFKARAGGVHRPRLGRVLRPLGVRQRADRLGGRERDGRADAAGRACVGAVSRCRPATQVDGRRAPEAASSPSRPSSAFQLADGDGFPVRVPVGPASQPVGSPRTCDGDGRRRSATAGARCRRRRCRPSRRRSRSTRTGCCSTRTRRTTSGRPSRSVRVTPLYTMLDETDLTNDYDRWNFTAGPWIWGPTYHDPWYTRSTMVGLRAGAYRTQQFAGGAYAALPHRLPRRRRRRGRLIDHWPWPQTQVGFNYERRIGGPCGEQRRRRAGRSGPSSYGRYILQYGPSLYLPPMHYTRRSRRYQDNFLPFARDAVAGCGAAGLDAG